MFWGEAPKFRGLGSTGRVEDIPDIIFQAHGISGAEGDSFLMDIG